jgi:hypothetical protein
MKIIPAAITLVIALGAAGAVSAQPSDNGMQGMRAACAGDVAKLCPDAKTREDRHQCMMQHADQVSDTCKAAAAHRREKMQEMKAAPAPD